MARFLGRSVSTISREVARNGGRESYMAVRAGERAKLCALRPRELKLVARPDLARAVEEGLRRAWSPEQIAGRLKHDHPDDRSQWVSHETIYQALYLQGRGGLRTELVKALRTGRARRRSPRLGRRRGQASMAGMVMISQRPPEVDDRAIPGHWEGDLLLGKDKRSQVATLVERTSRFLVLVHLPGSRRAEVVAQALATTVEGLPQALMRSLTWDQGGEMARHLDFTVATGVQVYFCDPHSPWQKGTVENTNGLLREYLPKGHDLSVLTPSDLRAIADDLNTRPRKALGWQTPAEKFSTLVQ